MTKEERKIRAKHCKVNVQIIMTEVAKQFAGALEGFNIYDASTETVQTSRSFLLTTIDDLQGNGVKLVHM